MKRTEKNKSIKDRLTYAYIRRIKKWMFCPACQDGKMAIDKGSTMWTCEECGYKLSADEFEDDYVFWFCDECQTYLNNQEEFDRKSQKHICKKCGYENDTSFSNIKGECLDCGKIISDPDATLCIDCKQIRKEKAKEWLKNAGKIVGVAATVAGTIYLASQPSDEDENMGYKYIPDKDDKGGDSMSERFPGIDWFCDRCNACLSDQDGFDDHKYTWKCTECGHKNSISSDDIYESEEDFRNPN